MYGTALYVCLIAEVLYVQSEWWSVTLPESISAVSGSCVVIPCSFTHPEAHSPAELVWYQYAITGYPLVYHRNRALIIQEYRYHTELVGDVKDRNCSLKIDCVTSEINWDKLYVWIDPDRVHKSSYAFYDKTVTLQVIDVAVKPDLLVEGDRRAGGMVRLKCSATHTCPSSPPTLSFSRHQAVPEVAHTEEQGGRWRVTAAISWTAQPEDDGKIEVCTVTHPGNRYASRELVLSISSAPRHVSVAQQPDRPGEGQSVTLSCHSKGQPRPHTYRWYRIEGSSEIQEPHVSQELHIQNITRWDSYSCAAINTFGESHSVKFIINVEYPPKILSNSICSQSSRWLKCECVVEANPEAKVKVVSSLPLWSFSLNSTSEFSRNTVSFVFFGALNVTWQNISCSAQNQYGWDVQHLQISSEAKGAHGGVVVGVFGGMIVCVILGTLCWRFGRPHYESIPGLAKAQRLFPQAEKDMKVEANLEEPVYEIEYDPQQQELYYS